MQSRWIALLDMSGTIVAISHDDDIHPFKSLEEIRELHKAHILGVTDEWLALNFDTGEIVWIQPVERSAEWPLPKLTD